MASRLMDNGSNSYFSATRCTGGNVINIRCHYVPAGSGFEEQQLAAGSGAPPVASHLVILSRCTASSRALISLMVS